MAIVYKITNNITSKSYVGYSSTTLEHRVSQHFKSAEKYEGSSRKFYNSIQKHGTNCWTAEVLYEGLTIEEAKQLEIHTIEKFNTYNNGYNSTLGGDGNNGIIMSDESNRKRSVALKGISKDYDRMHGKVHSEETKNKISESHKGMKKPWAKWSDESIRKRALTRRTLTEEQFNSIVDMKSKGFSLKDISKKLNIDYGIVKKWHNRKW